MFVVLLAMVFVIMFGVHSSSDRGMGNGHVYRVAINQKVLYAMINEYADLLTSK